MNNQIYSLIKFAISAFCITSFLLTLTIMKMNGGSKIDTATFSEIALVGIAGLTVVGWKAHDNKKDKKNEN